MGPRDFGSPVPVGDAEFRRVADYVDGRLDAPEYASARAEVERLLATSADARAIERWLRDVTRTARGVPLVDRSPLVEQRLRRYFTRWAHAQTVLTQPIPRFIATLVADSRQDGPLAGVRGSSDAVSLQYGCDVGELALDFRPGGPGRIHLSGQLLLDAPTTSVFFGVSALAAGIRRTTESDQFGRFLFPDLADAPTTLRLDNGELEVAATVDLRPTSSGPPDLGPPDFSPPDLGPPDFGPPDLGPPDLGPPDFGPPDIGPPDTGPATRR